MAYKLDPVDIKQIITIYLDGNSNRSIGKTLGIRSVGIPGGTRIIKTDSGSEIKGILNNEED